MNTHDLLGTNHYPTPDDPLKPTYLRNMRSAGLTLVRLAPTSVAYNEVCPDWESYLAQRDDPDFADGLRWDDQTGQW